MLQLLVTEAKKHWTVRHCARHWYITATTAAAAAAAISAGAFDGEDVTRIGYVSQFGNVAKQVVMTKTEGTTGMTGMPPT
jgi:hypothetical protein